MGKETRDRLVRWIEETVRKHYAGTVALVCLYGSHINGTAGETSDVDCYFVPKTQEGMALARTFLMEGVGYDLFPMSWQRLEAIARLEQSHQPLVGDVRVLYADSPADLERLEAVQRQLRDNLADPVFRQRAAQARFARACSRLPLATDDEKTARLKAGGLLMDVATAMTTAKVRVKELSGKDLPDGHSIFTIRFEVKNVAELEVIRNRLLNVRDVIGTRRGQN